MYTLIKPKINKYKEQNQEVESWSQDHDKCARAITNSDPTITNNIVQEYVFTQTCLL